jgi:WD40 repeat protein
MAFLAFPVIHCGGSLMAAPRTRLAHCPPAYRFSFMFLALTVFGGPEAQRLFAQDINAIRTLEGNRQPVRSVAFTPDGKILAAGGGSDAFSDEKTAELKLWDVATGKERATLTGHKWGVWCVAITPDGKTLASAGSDGVIKLWDVATAKETHTIKVDKGPIESLAFSPDGKTLVYPAGNDLVVWDVAARKQRATLKGLRNGAVALTFSPDGKTLAAGSRDSLGRLWEVESGKLTAQLKGHTSWVMAVVFTPDGKTVITGGGDKVVKVWDVESGKVRATFRGQPDEHLMEALSVALTPDGRFLAWGTYRFVDSKDVAVPPKASGLVKIWDLAAKKVWTTLKEHTGPVRSVAFSADGKLLATASGKTIRLWDTTGLVKADK